jgi:hypothetical protein
MAEFDIRQHVILSRITARGALQEYTSIDDRNKVVKTDQLGRIHNSLLHPDLKYYLFDTVHLRPLLRPVHDPAVASGNIAVGDVMDGTETCTFISSPISSSQEITLGVDIYIDDDAIPTLDEIYMTYQFSTSDPGLYMTVGLEGGANPSQSIPVLSADGAWHTDTIPVTAMSFDAGEIWRVTLTVNADAGQSLLLKSFSVKFDTR